MANIYVRSTDGSDSDNGSTWALAKATVAGAAAIDAAGDTIWLSQNHNELTTGAPSLEWNLAGSEANPTKVVCGNDSAEPPTSAADTAVVAVSGNGCIIKLGIGYAYYRGIAFRAGTGTEFSDIDIGKPGVPDDYWVRAEKCEFSLLGSGSYNTIAIYSSFLKECIFRLSAITHYIPVSGSVFIKGGGFHASSVSPDYVFSPSGPFVVEGFDFSNLGTAFSFIDVAGSGAQVVFKNCKLPASWAGALQEVTPKIQARVAAHNCDSGDTNYRLWVETLYGTIRDETTIVRTGGASNGATGLAWKVTTNTKPLFHAPLVTDEIVRWNEVTGSAITVTIEIVHDSATALKDDEVWLEIMYLGTSGAPLGAFVNDAKASIAATGADQTTSSATWTTTGMSNPNKQKLSVTFTPQEKGFIHAIVKLAKASYTVYVCPKLDVT